MQPTIKICRNYRNYLVPLMWMKLSNRRTFTSLSIVTTILSGCASRFRFTLPTPPGPLQRRQLEEEKENRRPHRQRHPRNPVNNIFNINIIINLKLNRRLARLRRRFCRRRLRAKAATPPPLLSPWFDSDSPTEMTMATSKES